ncbi:hypothetical protein I316_06426 [Kwoniella heveanensis BCC8398]|uniref:Peptidase C19 ubiquitin carboxyl-terminal hydrolase domain-containing protein n=1 Tax=Kwoniella heveanensis BCC8398 TaxID=1296120 RepID=A0A1B9GLG3_9TREE|nr:hypothetical protein I316_06426 [Kwoniella heveanensis BCC8398]
MSLSESTFTALKDMGIEPRLAREAASRYHNVEPAVNWCFGDGANWTPEPSRPDPTPSYKSFTPQNAAGTSVEHREVIDMDTPPITDPSPEPPHSNFASNNPFRNSLHQPATTGSSVSYQPSHLQPDKPPLPARPLPSTATATAPSYQHHQTLLSNTPTPSYTPTIVDNDDEDEELRKAIALSQADMGRSDTSIGGGEAMNVDQKRSERERSVRAHGPPPPSPDRGNAQSGGENRDVAGEAEIEPLFGPTNKADDEGKMALVPSTQTSTSMSKEDEDMDRAIQESLMTASFHSASAIKDSERPKPIDRPEGAPLIFYSESGHSTYAANFLQAMYAVPQLREAVEDVVSTKGPLPPSHGIRLLSLHKMTKVNTKSFVEIDDILRDLRGGREPGQLPPGQATKDFQTMMGDEMTTMILTKTHAASDPNDWKAIAEESQRLMNTEVDGEPPQRSTHVTFQRRQNTPSDIYSHLADLIWNSDMSGQGIIELGEILTVFIDWAYGAPRDVWRLDERVVLDRYLKANAAYAAQKRAHQSVMAGDARRMREKINNMTMHEGQNYHASLKTLIEHLGSSPPSDDSMVTESRREMKEKLEKILGVLEEKVREHNVELKAMEEAASSAGAFETDDPEYNQHVYTLRAVLFHDGALVGGNHLYAYTKDEQGGWWKVQEHEAERVEWSTIASDKTGLWMDGGPYMLLYSREGPRPRPQRRKEADADTDLGLSSERSGQLDENRARNEVDLIDIDGGNDKDDASTAGDVDMADPSPCPTPPSGSTPSTIHPKTTGVDSAGRSGFGFGFDEKTAGGVPEYTPSSSGAGVEGAPWGLPSRTSDKDKHGDEQKEQDEDLIML